MRNVRKSGPLRVVFFCVLILSIGLACLNLWQWYRVAVLQQAEAYDFGEVAGRAYYYKSEILYVFIHKFWGICFGVSSILMLLNFLVVKEWYWLISLILTLFLLTIYAVHQFVA
jgi:hypothetical protein